MSGGAEDLLTRGIAAARANLIDEARFYLEKVTHAGGTREQEVRAWLWLSKVADDPAEKRERLEQVLIRDPSHRLARRNLAILEGRIDSNQVIDPRRPPTAPQDALPQVVETRRFVCPKCGGKTVYAPDGRSLWCEFCAQQQQRAEASMSKGATLRERDFIAALATAKGHTRPVEMNSFTCEGCGASFVLAPDVLSCQCSYCGSAHVLEMPKTRQMIPPEGVIPFAVTREQAQQALRRWLDEENVRQVRVFSLRGLYLPAWTFDMSGEIRQVTEVLVSRGSSSLPQKLVRDGTHLVHEDDLLVLATEKLTIDLVEKEMDNFLLDDLRPFDHAYLADWPAEVYQVSVADASLVARRNMLENARRALETRRGLALNAQLQTSGVTVESFKLILLPLWIARYRQRESVYHVVINGQTGQVRAQKPRSRLQKFFDGLFD